jgi:hypothetical protein
LARNDACLFSPGLPRTTSLAQRWFLIRVINAHDPRLSGVDENSQSGASFPESGTSLKDVFKHNVRVRNLDGKKCNLLRWNLAALRKRCHRHLQWTLDFCQSILTDIYPEWLRQHVGGYNAWAQTKGRVQLAVTDQWEGERREKTFYRSSIGFTGKTGVSDGQRRGKVSERVLRSLRGLELYTKSPVQVIL